MADRYWVGNTGNWSDNTNHWSASSGGAAGASTPTASDNVFFDATSFSTTSTVTLDTGTPKTLNFVCTGLDQDVTIDGSLGFINTGGTVTLNANLTMAFTGLWDMGSEGANATNNITINGADLAGLIGGIRIGVRGGFNIPGFTGTYNLLDDFTAVNSDLEFATGNAAASGIQNSSLETNGFTVSVKKFTVTSGTNGINGGASTANLGTSTINTASVRVNNTGSGSVPSVTINGGSSTLELTPIASPQSEMRYNYLSGGGFSVTWGIVNLHAGTGSFIFNPGNGAASFAMTDFTIDAGSTFTGSSNNDITVSGTLTANGSVGNLIIFDGKGAGVASQGTISAAVANVSYVNVINSLASGAAIPFDDSVGGVDSGNNTNWIFPNTFQVGQVIIM